jgi:predicted secreted Zn-dependent protease
MEAALKKMEKMMSIARLAAPFLTIGLIAAAPGVSQTAPTTVATVPAVSPLSQIPGLTIQYYDVSGRTVREMRSSIEAQRPKDANGQVLPTAVKWSIGTNVKTQVQGTACRVTGATATMKSEVVLPRLVTVKGVKARELAQWQAYMTSIEAQQAARLRAVRSRLPEVERAILASTCEGADAAANRAIAEISKRPTPPAN